MTTANHDTPGSSNQQAKEEQDEWTYIVRKGKGQKLTRQRTKYHEHQILPPVAPPLEHFRPNPNPQLSAADIQAQHDRIADQFLTTPCFDKLTKLITTNLSSHVPIKRAVCLGLGAFEPRHGSSDLQRKSHIQLAAFLAMVSILAKETGQEIECIYQEPCFSEADKTFIASLGGKVVDSPGAYGLIDGTTFVYSVHLYRDVYAAALEKQLPGLFIGTAWDVWEVYPGAEKSPDFQRLREMDASYDKFLFPDDDGGTFHQTGVYWKAMPSADEPETDATAQSEESPSKTSSGSVDVDALADSIGKLQTDG